MRVEQRVESTVEAGESPPILICLLGSFRLLRTGQLLTIRPGGKREALLSRLALHARARISREILIDALWPDSEYALAVQSLNTLVYSLGKMLSQDRG